MFELCEKLVLIQDYTRCFNHEHDTLLIPRSYQKSNQVKDVQGEGMEISYRESEALMVEKQNYFLTVPH